MCITDLTKTIPEYHTRTLDIRNIRLDDSPIDYSLPQSATQLARLELSNPCLPKLSLVTILF